MKLCVAVLIAAVTVNCLVTAINGVAANDALEVPYIDMLLPPFEDVQENNKDAAAKINVTTKATPVSIKTTSTTTTTTTTTTKPITNEKNNILPELSIEALLPPLFEAKIEKEETKTTTTTTPKPTRTTTTKRSTTTTTKRSTTTTTKTTTTTAKPSTTTTTKPSKIEIPDLFLDSLLPPLFDNEIVDAKENNVAETTQKPTVAVKTTKKSYYQQQKDLHVNGPVETKTYQKLQQVKHLLTNNAGKEVKNYNKATTIATTTTSPTDKHVAESKTQTKQVSLAKQNIKLQSKIETMAMQHVAEQVSQHKHSIGSSQTKQSNNYSFDLYFGSTTARPPKYGLPTITPFPHRLGR